MIVGLILSGITGFYSSRLAVAKEITELKVTDATIQSDFDNQMVDILELKRDIDQINAKVDILLIDRGYNPKQIVSQIK